MDSDSVKQRLRLALSQSLPGSDSHRIALPPDYRREPVPPGTPIAEAAVLLALQWEPHDSRTVFPLILRPLGTDPHAGQVSLPGGTRHPGEDQVHCALREAQEEIGLDRKMVEVLGLLTPITIPVSGYRVEPVVGWVHGVPSYIRQEEEVQRILIAEPKRLALEGVATSVAVERYGVHLQFPAYLVENEKVWGATALILSEFLQVWRSVSDS